MKWTRRFAAVLAASTLLMAACSSSDDDSSGSGGDATTTQPPTTTDDGDTTTSTSTSDDTEPDDDGGTTDTTEPGPLADVEPFVGSYQGNWTNTTFGSTGPISFEITTDEAAGSVSTVIDIDGFVFDELDPDPETFTVAAEDLGVAQIDSSTFGPCSAAFGDDGAFEIACDSVPTPAIATFFSGGVITPSGVTATYVVTFPDGGEAEGEWTLARS